MTKSNQHRADRIDRLNRALRTASAHGTLISQAVADKVGLTPTALECLDLVQLSGCATAGDLARHTGLTTGAVTNIIDRLEEAGYVARQRDPRDRRRVYVKLKPESLGPVGAIYRPLQAATEKLYRRYTDDELDLIAEFTEQNAAIAADFVKRLSRENNGDSKSAPKK
jgi:DNA-binding MarR family transcriptional regulator